MTIKIEMLRCFAMVAQSGNLADAAEKLHRTPSAISMTLKQFEEHLGGALFESERKSKLTALGAFVFEQSISGLENFERTVAAIEGFARSEAGFVRVAAVPSVAEAILPKVVRGFLQDYPGVWIDIQDMDSAAVLREIQRERVDLGLATLAATMSEIESETLFADGFGVVCRADHPLAASSTPIEWSALEPYPFIANGICGSIANEDFQRAFAASALMVRNTTSLLAMIRAAVGVTVLPRLAIDSKDEDICFLKVADPRAQRRIDILRRAHSTPPPAARKFEAAVRRVVAEIALMP